MTDARHHNWDDSDLVMVSALEHWSYCPRQCALIHLDQVWDENLYTLRGRREVGFAPALRTRPEQAVRGVRAMLRSRVLPPPVNDARCDNCSLRESCMPAVVANTARLRGVRRALFLVPDDPERKPCTRS